MSSAIHNTQSSEFNTTAKFSVTDFIKLIHSSHNCIAFKKIYGFISGGATSGLLLSQIVYWNLPDDAGNSKLTVEQEDELWLVKKQEDWWNECVLTLEEYKHAIKSLCQKGFVIKKVFKFNGNPTTHLRVDWEAIMVAVFKHYEENNFSKNLFEKWESHQTKSGKATKPHIYNKETTIKERDSAIAPQPQKDNISKDNFKKSSKPMVSIHDPSLEPEEIAQGTLHMTQEALDRLGVDFKDPKLVIRIAYKYSRHKVRFPEKYKKKCNDALALRDWLEREWNNPQNSAEKPTKKTPDNNYTNAGSLPLSHKEAW